MKLKILGILLLLFVTNSLFAQKSFNQKLVDINEQLNELSGSVTGLTEEVNFAVANAPIQEFIRSVAETHGLNVHIDPSLNINVTNNFTNAKVKDVFYFLCSEYKLDLRFVNNIISFYKYTPPAAKAVVYKTKEVKISYDQTKDLLTVDLARDSLVLFVRQLIDKTNKNIVLSPGLENNIVNGFIKNMPFEKALEQIAFSNNLLSRRTKDGFYVIESAFDDQSLAGNSKNKRTGRTSKSSAKRGSSNVGGLNVDFAFNQNDTLISLDAVNVSILDIINEVSEKLGKDYILFSEPEGSTTAKVKNIDFESLLDYLLLGTSHTFNKEEGIYLIGDRSQEGFRKTKLVKLQFRTVKEIEKVIPTELTKGVQINLFPELNALILSGGAPQIREISSFLKAIDEPVPNILIEILVVEFNKGYNLQTGIKAMLGDSAVATKGQVFPAVNLTLGSNSINNVLSKLGGKGLVNLGKVTPNFYVALQALEDNNNVDIRSTPKLSTLNGHEANLTIGKSVYYVQETQNINPGVNPITTVSQQYRQVEANLQIKINPSVSGNEHITLDIEAEFSDFIPPEIDGAPPGNATRRFDSQIRVKNEDMIVLGGLEETRKSETSSGVPLLSRIPILKWIFSSKSKQKSESKLVVFIKPTIIF